MKDRVSVEVIFEVRNGRTLSRRKDFYDDGTLKSDGLFAYGNQWGWDIPVGILRKYHHNAQLKSEEHYDEKGQKNGESAFYNDRGTLTSRVIYLNDKITGEVHFDQDGKEIEKKSA